jgi:hypothetical protein
MNKLSGLEVNQVVLNNVVGVEIYHPQAGIVMNLFCDDKGISVLVDNDYNIGRLTDEGWIPANTEGI